MIHDLLTFHTVAMWTIIKKKYIKSVFSVQNDADETEELECRCSFSYSIFGPLMEYIERNCATILPSTIISPY